MSKTVVGLFSTVAEANRVKQALASDGFEAQHISIVANDADEYATPLSSMATANESGYTDIGSGGGTGIGEKISSFFRSLTGGDEDDHKHYTTGVSKGGALLAVTVDDDEADEVAATLKEHGARNVDEDYEGDSRTAAPAYAAASMNAEEGKAIPIVEEELIVGKRQVSRGGVRIYSHVVERPVEADVTLRDEYIHVERRPVNRAATDADFAAGSASVELLATGEEAVVGKASRVVEEVYVGKETSERTESISDTVRKTEVDVEHVPEEKVAVTSQTY